MVDYETEIMKLKDKNEVMRLKTLTDKKLTAGEGDKASTGQAKSKEDQVAQLQEQVQKKLQELVKAKEKDMKSEKDKQALLSQKNELEKKYADEKNKYLKSIKDRDQAQRDLRTA